MSAGAMNISVRNNLNLLSKRVRLRHRLGGYNPDVKTEYNLPKATTKQLKAIAKRLKQERKVRMLKVILCTAVAFVLLLCVFIYSVGGII
ncbi:hypothetical protein [Winogradskyella ludwigii]|uniref:hypothetical protein n=1 Tax=Winogradskyella ludwigii TaxID=2686076 RepID=UPI0015CEEA94|nr:hypothetical protein [Winogradskyella ludwigii]